ncbi:MAG: hypothetical protein LBT62_02685 [Deltaproteobacteria bacterium]|jgi:hypothetical protein|nr:hypothetical protein [Deltaproteobacteria bacterium]
MRFELDFELDDAGKIAKTAEALALRRQMPLPPLSAKFVKENVGVDLLANKAGI